MRCDFHQATTCNGSTPHLALSVITKQQADMLDGYFDAVEIPWFIPTSSAKAFHPRTLVHNAYKQSIMAVW